MSDIVFGKQARKRRPYSKTPPVLRGGVEHFLCPHCGHLLPVVNFYNHAGRRSSWCRQCTRDKAKETK